MMRYFAALLVVQLKSVLRSAASYVSTAFFLAVMLLLAAVLPENNGVNLQVGVTVSGDIASTAANALLENAGFTVIRYTDDDALRRDVLAGVLRISAGRSNGAACNGLFDRCLLYASANR